VCVCAIYDDEALVLQVMYPKLDLENLDHIREFYYL